ncbi:DNA polymerase beta superfamily protein [Bacillus massilinigeriensis]|uniref:DNA polymerase beta superfamily protein n=1 Tax=Bacillus mediterraneensis TaxID=1805474 RepID=UPI0008F84A50|nr:nucleotidyltransferase domain-containing protein [Bacillus mediterraneensis]
MRENLKLKYCMLGELKDSIAELLRRKMAGNELDLEPRLGILHDFIEKEIAHLENYVKSTDSSIPDPTAELDVQFRETLQEVWG